MVESATPLPVRHRLRFAAVAIAVAIAATLALATVIPFGVHGSASVTSETPIVPSTTPRTVTEAVRGTTTRPTPTTKSVPTVAAPSTPTPSPAVAAPVPVPVAVAAAVPVEAQPVAVAVEPAVATLVAEVETAGIEPGSNWSWSMGDTATHCGSISGSGTGCTYGAGGLEYTVFAGSPTLSLVAHELANAETQNDAVPNLLSEVAAADGGTSWSPTDAVASCLVAHFVGIQDAAAGSWTCSPVVAAFVANNIHDTLSTTVGALPG
jgi:hypothetical protein